MTFMCSTPPLTGRWTSIPRCQENFFKMAMLGWEPHFGITVCGMSHHMSGFSIPPKTLSGFARREGTSEEFIYTGELPKDIGNVQHLADLMCLADQHPIGMPFWAGFGRFRQLSLRAWRRNIWPAFVLGVLGRSVRCLPGAMWVASWRR